MSQTQFSLSWEAHRKNVSQGLSSLQQKGEFVDMTIAADGHFVKVHQVVVALASPYLRGLLASIDCPQPVIWLNKVSYKTLCLILEYIYMGEVHVNWEDLNQFAQAAKDLCIKGLEDMKLQDLLAAGQAANEHSHISDNEEEDRLVFQIENTPTNSDTENFHIESVDNNIYTKEEIIDEEIMEEGEIEMLDEYEDTQSNNKKENYTTNEKSDINTAPDGSLMQYTVSNQGSLQMILNRYIYYLKYTNRNNSRQWRCTNYLTTKIKCPAQVVTKDGVVKMRIAAHTHPYHDEKILKKVSSGSVFTAIPDAEKEGRNRLKMKNAKNEK